MGYGLRLVSGPGADRTGRYWTITIAGYLLQMSVVPLLAVVSGWQMAAVLVVAERVGKAIRNPPRDALLAHAAKEMGYGWGFGVHEALDQFGAMVGPLLIALVLAVSRGDYRLGFVFLAAPAVITLGTLGVARRVYPRPQDLESVDKAVHSEGMPRRFWIYLAAAAPVSPISRSSPITCSGRGRPRWTSLCSTRSRWRYRVPDRWCSGPPGR